MAHGASQPSCSFFGTRHDEKQSVPQDKEDDALLARDLNALTMDERNLLYDEVGGVPIVVYLLGTFVCYFLLSDPCDFFRFLRSMA